MKAQQPLVKPTTLAPLPPVPIVSKAAPSYESAFIAFANKVYDTVGLRRLIDEITLIERSLFKDKPGMISQKARDYLTGGIISVFEDIENAGLEPANDQRQLQFLKDLIFYLNSLPVVKVTIAFDPTHNFVMRLNNQISEIMAKKVILDVVIDENVIGGAIFEFGGKVLELTLRNKLNEELVGLVEKAYPQLATES